MPAGVSNHWPTLPLARLHHTGPQANWNPPACAKLVTEWNKWVATAPMLLGVDHAAAGTDGHRLYVFGGRHTGSNYPSPGETELVPSLCHSWQAAARLAGAPA